MSARRRLHAVHVSKWRPRVTDLSFYILITLAFTSGSASRADVGLDVAGMWRGCGRDAGGDVAWMLGAMWPAMCPPYRRLNGDFTRISNSHPRSNPL
jgi:hypothetical protein